MHYLQWMNCVVGLCLIFFLLLLSQGAVYYSAIAWATTCAPFLLALMDFSRKGLSFTPTILCGLGWTVLWLAETFLGVVMMRDIYFVSLGSLWTFDPAWFLYATFVAALMDFTIPPILLFQNFLKALKQKGADKDKSK